jgi:DNA topoisomerase-6 subunit B
VRQQSDRREIFMRYLKEVSSAVSVINGTEQDKLYQQLLDVAKKVTSDADMKLDDRGRKIEEEDDLDLGGNVLIVDPSQHAAAINRASSVSVADEEIEDEVEE